MRPASPTLIPESEVATTGSDEAIALPASVERFRRSRLGNLTRKPIAGPTFLTKLHLRLISLMVHGIERNLPHFPDIAPNEPLSLVTAAVILRIRLRNARDLMMLPIFQTALNKEIALLRNGAKAKAMHKVIDQLDTPPEKPASRKIILEAADRILGDDIGKATPAAQINVQINNQTIQPGYVIRVPLPVHQEATIDQVATSSDTPIVAATEGWSAEDRGGEGGALDERTNEAQHSRSPRSGARQDDRSKSGKRGAV